MSQSDPTCDIHLGDNLEIIRAFADASFELIYIDPPFNTGSTRSRSSKRMVRDDEAGDHVGFKGKRYRTEVRDNEAEPRSYDDHFEDYLAFLEPRLRKAHRLLTPAGSFFLHIDWREAHYCKVLLDEIFGRASFMNEIIWAYDYGGRSRSRWPTKHDTIFWYAKNPDDYSFNYEAMERIPYMAPGLVTKEKAERGKTPTDVWWHTIVSPTGNEKTGYPTQKPLGVLKRIISVHTNPGDRVLDFFAGSGTTGEAALRLGRSAVLVDHESSAIETMTSRLSRWNPVIHRDGSDLRSVASKSP